MHEDLLGYLLGALEPHEMRRVAQWLRDDPSARRQLAEIERSLRPLEESFKPVELPPPDLVARTLASLPPLPMPNESVVDQQMSAPVTLAPMQSGVDAPRYPTMTWLDWLGGATAAAVVLGLLIPALAQGRFEARKMACQDHLRQLGTALTQFVNRNQQKLLPAVAEAGPEAFAGVYAPRLIDAGLLNDPSIRWCPSLDLPADDEVQWISMNEIISVDDLHRVSADRLRQIQRFVGGHYSYNLGVIEHDQLFPPRYESRSSFAVMSDAPLGGMSDGNDGNLRVGHSATGINVLFEDGRVQFFPLSSLESMPDHPLLNHRGDAEAGVNADDASLAPSWRPPFVNVRQR